MLFVIILMHADPQHKTSNSKASEKERYGNCRKLVDRELRRCTLINITKVIW